MNIWEIVENIINGLVDLVNFVSGKYNFNQSLNQITNTFNEIINGNVSPLIFVGSGALIALIVIRVIKILL